jgi:hypothetical protein
MPFLGDRMVQSPAFTVELRRRDAAIFVRKVESEAIKIVGKYSPKTELVMSWDIRGSNVRLNWVFELNGLQYSPYTEGVLLMLEMTKGTNMKIRSEEGTSKGKDVIATTRKRKMEAKGTERIMARPRASRCFVEELAETSAGPWEVMTSPDLRETSSQMLKVIGGQCHRKDPVPRVTDVDYFMPCMAHEF